MKRKIDFLPLILFSLLINYGNAQTIVNVDPDFCTVKGRLPFDVPFFLDIPKSCIDNLNIKFVNKVAFIPKKKNGTSNLIELFSDAKWVTIEDKPFFRILCPNLEPNRHYDIVLLSTPQDALELLQVFKLIFEHKSDDNIGAKIVSISKKRVDAGSQVFFTDNNGNPEIKKFKNIYKEGKFEKSFKNNNENDVIKHIENEIELASDYSFFSNTYFNNLITDRSFNFKADIGYVYYGFDKKISGVMPYIGIQYEIKPYNSDISFSTIQNKSLWRRLSLSAGLSLASMAKGGKRVDFTGNKSLLFGAGYRLTNAFRITFGGILFYREDKNPLIDDKKLALTPYVGLSLDGSLSEVLKDLSSIIPTVRR